MSAQLPDTSVLVQSRYGLLARLAVVAAFLGLETLLISALIQSQPLDALTGVAKFSHDVQHYLFRFIIAYAASFAILLYLRGGGGLSATSAAFRDAPVRMSWLFVHIVLLMPFAWLSAILYSKEFQPFWLLAAGWNLCGTAAAAALFAGVAPLRTWMQAVRQTRRLPLYSLLPAAGALLAFKASQLLWAPAAALTFRLVRLLVLPLAPSLRTDAATLTLITDHFAVQVSEVCSGLEGVGLMLAFCAAWLWYFRREYIFPRALIIVPVAVLVIFLLNAVRIAALVLIGEAGYQRVASVGFHSQAGWIAFNLAAFAVALVAKRSAWLNRAAHDSLGTQRDAAGTQRDADRPQQNATAAYLMPLLAILAAGMVAHALSAGFDLLYALRLVCAAVALWVYRRYYRTLDWNFSWRGVSCGTAVFAVWAVFAHFATTPESVPNELLQLPVPLRAAWLTSRAAAAVITVPIAEELAFRGFVMRRIFNADFEAVPMRSVTWMAVGMSAVAFGVTHGNFWPAAIVAGLAYGALAVKTGKIGECVVAHATTNTLIAIQVLLFGQWQLW